MGQINTAATIAIGDINNDGFTDIVVASNESGTIIQLYLNDGKGNFTKTDDVFPVTENSNPLWNFGIVLRDFNRDGLLDIATADAWRGVNIYLNSKDGRFNWSQAILVPAVNEVKGIDAADINGDGYDDLVFGGHNGLPDRADRIYLNDGTGKFVDSGQRIGDDVTWSTVFGDLNNDGFIDYVSINRYREHTAKIHVNNGFGIFDKTIDLPTTQSDDSNDVKLADLNSDGLLDIVIASSKDLNLNTTSKVFLNEGNFSFALSNGMLGELNCETKGISIIDMNNDGYYDILLGNWNYANYVYLNDGTGSFTKMNLNIQTYETEAIGAADLNNDGFVDVVVGNRGDGRYRIYLNDGVGLNKNIPDPPVMLKSTVGDKRCYFSWKQTGFPDITELNSLAGLTYNIRIGTKPGENDIVSGVSAVGIGHLGSALSYIIQGLQAGSYYWNVQTVDSTFLKSSWSQVGQFTIAESSNNSTPSPVPTPTPSPEATGGGLSMEIIVAVVVIAVIIVISIAAVFVRRKK